MLPYLAKFRRMGEIEGLGGDKNLPKLAIWRFLVQTLSHKNAIKSELAINGDEFWKIWRNSVQRTWQHCTCEKLLQLSS